MRLYGTYLSPFARRVGIALMSRDIAFDHDPLNGYEAPGRASELNPVGRVPVLELDDGEMLIDSLAIIDHLNAVVPPDHAFVPTSGKARRDVLQAAAIASALFEAGTAAYFQDRLGDAADTARLARLREQLHGGLKALDALPFDSDRLRVPDVAAISAVVAYDYLGIVQPAAIAAANVSRLAAFAGMAAAVPAFASTHPAPANAR